MAGMESERSTPALLAMRTWLVGERNQSWLARKVGVSRPTIFRWVTGECSPEPQFRQAIHELSRGVVNFDDWYTDEQLAVAYAHNTRILQARRLQRAILLAGGAL